MLDLYSATMVSLDLEHILDLVRSKHILDLVCPQKIYLRLISNLRNSLWLHISLSVILMLVHQTYLGEGSHACIFVFYFYSILI